MARGLAVFDMDRTLTTQAVAHVVGDALGVREQVKALSARRDAGELSQQQVTEGIAALLQGVRVADFEHIVAPIPLSPGAAEAVAALRAGGVVVAVCSDSFSRAVAPLAARLGVGLWAANVLEE
ncbi:MAG TPA: HAD-IB family phosphatase, partial [Candidatus Thermoplasmatota archaeon]|nr:HAD-IB family phosphatase [Candidatus Thermoplasmatota archaeon]